MTPSVCFRSAKANPVRAAKGDFRAVIGFPSLILALTLLSITFSRVAIATPPDPLPSITLPLTGQTIRLDLELLVNGEPPTVAWSDFLFRYFNSYDRNGDGSLDESESRNLISLPLPLRQQFHLDFATLDNDANGRVSLAEFVLECRDRGFKPVMVKSEPSSADSRLAAVIRHWLDENQDGLFTVAELRRLPRTMTRYDFDEDGAVSLNELLDNTISAPSSASLAPPASPPRESPAHDRSLRLRIDLSASAPSVAVSEDNQRLLVPIPGGSSANVRFRGPDSAWMLAIDANRQIPNVKSAGDFLAAQLQRALADNSDLPIGEIQKDNNLGGLRDLARIADRNRDERLSLAELQSHAQFVAAALHSQLWVTLVDRSSNLFSLLDANLDGRLTPAELTNVAELLSIETSTTTLPRQFQLTFSAAPIANWAGLRFPAIPNRSTPAPSTPDDIPAWFRVLDRNRDHILSPREFLGPPTAFAHLDRDHNGHLTIAEATQKP
jgi:Ca2+-binding EF-hand superfamily protein